MMADQKHIQIAIDIAIKLGSIAFILFISFLIIQPFLGIILWAIILAVALFPLIEKLTHLFHTSRKKVVIIFSIVTTLTLLSPTYVLSDKAIESIKTLSAITKKEEIKIPPAPQNIKEIPFIGEKAYTIWHDSSKDLEATLKTFAPQIKYIAAKGIKTVGETLKMILFSIVAILIASYFILYAEKFDAFYTKLSTRLIGEKGKEWAKLTALTIRSVATGVIGVAIIQAALSLIGLLIMDVPFSILIAIGVLFLAIIALPPILILGPVIAYVLMQDSSTSAIVFSIYLILVGSADNILKPLLMGRGVDIPMLVVLIGAIGGMLLMGLIGLFVGAVIFALCYKLFMLWLDENAVSNS